MVCIIICSKYNNTTNTAAFLIMYCVLFAANELNNTPNNSRRVGGEVAFFPGGLIGDVWLAAYFPTAHWTCLPVRTAARPIQASLHASYIVTLMHAAQWPASIVISNRHRAITCNYASVINYGYVHVYMHATKQGHRHFFCKSARRNASIPTYKVNTR